MLTAESVAIDDAVRVRPSVSWVERRDGIVEFFLGNTRTQRTARVANALIRAMQLLDGTRSLATIATEAGAMPSQLLAWVTQLVEWCIAERIQNGQCIEASPWRRSLHMLGDFVPDYDVLTVWKRIGVNNFVVLGCGAVGSWVADGIARCGGMRFVLVDPDVVARSNLNRSLFAATDVGSQKTTALANRLRAINPNARIEEHPIKIDSPERLDALLPAEAKYVAISCMDQPNVDVAAGYANRLCVQRGFPLVVAGGYNLHLSLIGITVLPRQSACFTCSLLYLKRQQDKEAMPVRKLPRQYRNIGNIAPLAAMTASIASMEAIRAAAQHRRFWPSMLNRRGEYSFIDEMFNWYQIPRQSDCEVCGGV